MLLLADDALMTRLFYHLPMSEHQEPQQIGRLAEEYARLRDEVYRVEERVERAHRACLAVAIFFQDIVVQEDHLTLRTSDELANSSTEHLQSLLSAGELVQLFHERNRLRTEMDDVRSKLRGWLNHI